MLRPECRHSPARRRAIPQRFRIGPDAAAPTLFRVRHPRRRPRSHAMNDSFAVIRWTEPASARPPPACWSESVAAEVLVFFFLGPRLLRALSPAGALAVAAVCGVVRWGSSLRRSTSWPLAWCSPAWLHICAAPSRNHAPHRRYGAARRRGHRTGRLRPGRGRGRYRRFASALRVALRAFRNLVFGAWRRFAWLRFPSSGCCSGRSRRLRARAKRANHPRPAIT
jgi:hypothetical protein